MTTEEQLKALIERTEIADLLFRYFAAVDDKRIDLKIASATFAGDGKIIRPDGLEITGPENIADAHSKSFARFKATHHTITNCIVDIDNDTATLRSNVIANHMWADSGELPHLNNKNFLANGVFSAKAVKVNGHWRISELSNKIVWREGDGMQEVRNFGRPKE